MQNHIVIIGNGIAGITTARHIRKLRDDKITVISSESKHFFSRTALMYIYMGHMKYEHIKPYEDWFWGKNRIDLVQAYVEQVDTDEKLLTCDNGQTIYYDKLVIASGSKARKFGWKGQDLPEVQGLITIQELRSMEKNTQGIKRAVVVGGGLIGIEMVEMLRSRNIEVTYLVREFKFWQNILPHEEADLVGDHIREHHIDLRLNKEMKEILSDENGHVRAVLTTEGEEIPCQFVGLTIGVQPNIEFLKSSRIKTDQGVLVNGYFETNVPDVYSIGDCAQFASPLPNRRHIEQIWYTGRMHGETLARTLCGVKTAYKPGNWFNSAKLLDIEYQVYSKYPSFPEDGVKHLFWQGPDRRKTIRIIYEENGGKIQAFSLLGVRYRHEVCDRWIKEERHIEYVLENLREVNFDPEFYRRNEKELVALYNAQHPGRQIQLKKKKSLFSFK
ncbi:MAG: FAD-dependent oxidoreductase [Flavobacteriales bacterium]|nr:FAD-dependent oxidoreductase [Flavobacteriales bacterium]